MGRRDSNHLRVLRRERESRVGRVGGILQAERLETDEATCPLSDEARDHARRKLTSIDRSDQCSHQA